MPEPPRIAIVVDALPAYRGAERVVGTVLEMFPRAEVHTLIYVPSGFVGTPFAGRTVHTSFIQTIPGGKAHYRGLLPLLPLAIESLDVGGSDIVLSFSYAVAHGVKCRPDQLHISYTFAPMRYAWQEAGQHFQSGPMAPAARMILRCFRTWDKAVAARIQHMLAISGWTAQCVERAYGINAGVLYPPVETDRFEGNEKAGDYFVAFSRLVPHKRLELIIAAFNELRLPLVVIGDGPERAKLERQACGNITFLGAKSNLEAAEILSRARALVHASQEDFGLAMAEAQAAGRPVIAYRGGAAPEIVVDGKTGVLFEQQSTEAIVAAVRCFLEDERLFGAEACRSNARRFDKRVFQRAFGGLIESQWHKFGGSGQVEVRG